MTFLCQTYGGKVIHDFVFELLQAETYAIWRGETFGIIFHEGTDFTDLRPRPDELTPVGSVEFVSEFLRAFHPKAEEALRPLNVPERLFPFAGRRITDIRNRDDFLRFRDGIPGFQIMRPDLYRKSNDKIKNDLNGLVSYPYDATDFRSSQVSEVIDIVSEWRAFVFRGEIRDLRNYSGDFTVFPDPERIRAMTDAYGDKAPVAYTLDVAVTAGGETVVIECHRFFSCGLYGFSDHKLIPYMLSQEWFEMRNTRNKI